MERKPRLSNNKKKQVKGLVDQASRALGNGNYNTCEQLCAKIKALQPGNLPAINLLGIMYGRAGQPDKAVALFEHAITTSPQCGEFHANLAQLYLDQGRHADALRSYRQAIECGIKALPVLLNFGRELMAQQLHEEAITLLEQTRASHPRDPDLLIELFRAYYNAHRIEEAEVHLKTVLRHRPGHADAQLLMGQLASQQGRFEDAEAGARAALAADPDCVEAYATLARVKTYDSGDDSDAVAMAALHERIAPDSPECAMLGFAIAKVMEDMGQYDRAFDYLKNANDIRHRYSVYHQEQELAHLQAVMEAYDPEIFTRTSDLDDTTPIFIVGMPRCGSTLVEQILISHPDVQGMGECDYFEAILTEKSGETESLTPAQIVTFSPEQWNIKATRYLEKLKKDVVGAHHITDKTLSHTRLIGAIHCALPKARIVHVRRHPLDTCLSIYKQNLLGTRFDFGSNLDELGHHYRMYLKLMQHWRDVLPPGVMYELDYEKLVSDQEGETRKLLDACGLDWNDQCLKFHQADNMVRTASLAQVRRGMYRDSVAVWKHYEKHLQPLIRILGTESTT